MLSELMLGVMMTFKVKANFKNYSYTMGIYQVYINVRAVLTCLSPIILCFLLLRQFQVKAE